MSGYFAANSGSKFEFSLTLKLSSIPLEFGKDMTMSDFPLTANLLGALDKAFFNLSKSRL